MKSFISEAEAIYSKINQDRFSGVIYTTFENRPMISIEAGFVNREQKIPNRLDTKFNLSSNSKIFTSIAIAQLVQQGFLYFDDPLGKFLEDYPDPETKNVTIHQLLTHTGGTGDIFGPQLETHLEQLKTPMDYIHLYGHRKLEFKPGSRFANVITDTSFSERSSK